MRAQRKARSTRSNPYLDVLGAVGVVGTLAGLVGMFLSGAPALNPMLTLGLICGLLWLAVSAVIRGKAPTA